MIEVIYKDEKPEAKGSEGTFSLPKNIRQIGSVSDDCRIYMEDYVYTFLTKTAEADSGEEKNTLAVFTGETKWEAGAACIFIKGAVSGEPKELSTEHIELDECFWKKVHEAAEAYFQGQEIVGWFFGGRLLPMEAGELFCRIHRKHFGGEKVLMLMDPVEREEAFFRYENTLLVRQKGYYLYYEKNPQMQAYMVEKNPQQGEGRKEEVPDEAVKAFRKIIQNKKKQEEKETEEVQERPSVFSYAATACLALAVVAAGARFYQNYQSMQSVNRKTEAVSALTVEQEESNEETEQEEQNLSKKNQAESDTAAGEKQKPAAVLAEAEEENPSSGEKEPEKEQASSDKEETSEEEPEENRKTLEEARDSEASSDAAVAAGEEKLSEEDQAIYKEESDLRKAERRVQEARAEEKASAEAQKGEQESSLEKSSAAAAETSSYIIRPGDTLYQISMEKYGTMDAVAEICRMNGIRVDEIIYPGQIIVLP